MRKIFLLLSIIFILICMVGCSDTNSQQSQDSAFIKSIEKATKARWDYIDKVDSGSIKIDDDYEYLKECVKKESDELYKYVDVEFSDAKLKKLATDYINGVKLQEESLAYYINDYLKYDTKFQEGYDMRSVALLELIESYGVKVDESQFEDLRTNSQIVEKNKKLEDSIESMISSIEFKKESDSSGYKEYAAVVENTSEIKFDSFDLEISLLDKDGVVIDSQYASVSNWKSGKSAKFTFGTSEEFETIEWEYNYYLEE